MSAATESEGGTSASWSKSRYSPFVDHSGIPWLTGFFLGQEIVGCLSTAGKIDHRANLASLSALLFLPTLVSFCVLRSPNDRTASRAVKRLSERVQHDSRVNNRTLLRVVIRIFDALAAKPSIPSVRCALLQSRKDAINASGVSYDAPWIVYICLRFSQRGEHRT
jgi:hypothetical protein